MNYITTRRSLFFFLLSILPGNLFSSPRGPKISNSTNHVAHIFHAATHHGSTPHHAHSFTHSTSNSSHEHTSTSTPTQEAWTVLVYMARNNSLSDFGPFNQKQMMAVNNPNVRILVFDCFNDNGTTTAKKLVISHNKITILETINNVDSGSQELFTQACLWAANYPADNLAIIAWNHGSGMLNRYPWGHNYLMRGFCYDDGTGNYLDDIKLMNALTAVLSARNGKKIDFFGFDACLMADVEIAAALAPYVHVAVASQQTIPGDGWNYAGFLRAIRQTTSAKDLANAALNSYKNYYNTSGEGFTLSALDLSIDNSLNQAIDNLAQSFNAILQSAQADALITAINNSLNSYFDEPTYMDLIDFCSTLKNNLIKSQLLTAQKIHLRTLVSNCITAAKKMILGKVTSSDLTAATGLSIYFPQQYVESSYGATFFAQHNHWNDFVNAIFGS